MRMVRWVALHVSRLPIIWLRRFLWHKIIFEPHKCYGNWFTYTTTGTSPWCADNMAWDDSGIYIPREYAYRVEIIHGSVKDFSPIVKTVGWKYTPEVK